MRDWRNMWLNEAAGNNVYEHNAVYVRENYPEQERIILENGFSIFWTDEDGIDHEEWLSD